MQASAPAAAEACLHGTSCLAQHLNCCTASQQHFQNQIHMLVAAASSSCVIKASLPDNFNSSSDAGLNRKPACQQQLGHLLMKLPAQLSTAPAKTHSMHITIRNNTNITTHCQQQLRHVFMELPATQHSTCQNSQHAHNNNK